MRVSFRYKIQFVVTLILIVVLGLYMSLASQTLLKEKISSLLETTSANVEVAASRVGRLLTLQMVWLEKLISQDKAVRDPEFLKNANLLAVFHRKDQRLETLFERSPEYSTLPLPVAMQNGINIFATADHNSFWIVKQTVNEGTLFSLWSKILLEKEQNMNPDSLFYFLSENDRSWIGPSASRQQIEDLSHQISQTKFQRSLFSTQIKVDDESFIAAFAPIEGFPAFVSVVYPEAIAFEAVRNLQFRSLYFAIFVVGLTGVLSLYIGRALTQKLTALTVETEKIALGNLDSVQTVQTNDEIGDLSKSIVSMAGDLKKYIREMSEKSRMEVELKTAKTVQDMLFPKKNWENLDFEVQGYYESASECGGDLWFYWQTGDYLFFLVGDATGHGAPAALITSAARSTLACVEHSKEVGIDAIASLLHHAVRETSMGTILMTAWIGRLDLKTRNIEYVNCSHEPPFVVKQDGTYEVINAVNNPRIGDPASRNVEFQIGRFNLQPGQTLCLYTDGISTIEAENGKRLSDRKFSILVSENFSGKIPVAEGIRRLIQTLKEFSGNCPLDDDMTMLIVSSKNKGSSAV